MRYDFGLAWRNIRTNWIETIVPIIVVGLAIGLSLTIITIADGLQEGIILASDPFGALVIGPKGSAQQLVTNTVLLQGDPVGTINFALYEELETDPQVRLAVPIALADNVGNAKVVGTNLNFFELRRAANEPPAFQIAEGRLFDASEAPHQADQSEADDNAAGEDHEQAHNEHIFEAVLGAKAAEDLGLSIDDTFQTRHGLGRSLDINTHEDFYRVVGILEKTTTPYDAAVFTPLQNIWDVHAVDPNAPRSAAAELAAEQTAGYGQLTAILVVPSGFQEQNLLFQRFYNSSDYQAAFPGKELTEIFRLISDAQELLTWISFLVLGIAAFTIFLAMYSKTIAREQAIAIMRSLGSRRLNVFRIILFETLLIAVAGALLGRAFGYGTAAIIAEIFSDRSAIPVPIRVLPMWEAILWALPVGVGILAGLIPAVMAYRVNVVEKLFPS
jgi:putative ABC transport system permease protein